jgi:hypothetical protein
MLPVDLSGVEQGKDFTIIDMARHISQEKIFG